MIYVLRLATREPESRAGGKDGRRGPRGLGWTVMIAESGWLKAKKKIKGIPIPTYLIAETISPAASICVLYQPLQ